jgi:hypothetical protein
MNQTSIKLEVQMLRCILQGFAIYAIALTGSGPVDGVDGFYVKPDKAKKTSDSPGNFVAQQSPYKGDAAVTPTEQEERT